MSQSMLNEDMPFRAKAARGLDESNARRSLRYCRGRIIRIEFLYGFV